MSRKTIVVISVLALVAGFAVWYWFFARGSDQAITTDFREGEKTSVEISTVPSDRLPERFPTDIPLEPNAEVNLNFNAVNLDGKFQSSREFVSAKSAEENFIFYQAALKNNNWQITQAFEDVSMSQYVIMASKAGNELNIRVYIEQGQVRVSINNLTEP